MRRMTRREVLGAFSLAIAGVPLAAQRGAAVQVYKDPTCGCCALWVEHLRKAGFTATVTDVVLGGPQMLGESLLIVSLVSLPLAWLLLRVAIGAVHGPMARQDALEGAHGGG